MLDFHVAHAEAMLFKKSAAFAACVGIGDRAAGLGFGVLGHEFGQLPELALAFGEQNPSDFVRPTMVDHHLDNSSGTRALTQLCEDRAGMRRVVNDAKVIDQVVGFHRNAAAELLRVACTKTDAIFEAEDNGALRRQIHGLVGKVHSRDLRAGAGEVDGVRAYAAADFQDFFAAPAVKVCECRNVIFDEVFPGFHLIEIFPGADRGGRMTDIAGTSVPVIADARDFDVSEGPGHSIIRQVVLELEGR